MSQKGTKVLVQLNIHSMKVLCLKTVTQRKRGESDPEDADCNVSETIKDEATFEDKIVDTMVLEDPQNMYQALEK